MATPAKTNKKGGYKYDAHIGLNDENSDHDKLS